MSEICDRTWEVREEIRGALAEILEPSLATSDVLEDWRRANVVPLLNKGCKYKPKNYRTVAGNCRRFVGTGSTSIWKTKGE